MNFAGLQKRAKNNEKNDKGKFKSKKRFGKSLANKAPSMLLTIINRKLGYYDEKLIEINTFEAKASQFNHFDGIYTKKSLSQRWNDFNRFLHHQMHIEKKICDLPEGRNDAHTKRKGRHKHAVHNIDMKIGRTRLLHQIDFLSQSGAVRRQNGG